MKTNSQAHPTVFILAPKPPPVGGVAVHASRLVVALQNKGLNVQHIDTANLSLSQFVSLIVGMYKKLHKSVIHFHTWGNDWRRISLLALTAKPFAYKMVGTWHMIWSQEVKAIVSLFGVKHAVKFAFNNYDKWLVLNENAKNELLNFGVKNERITQVSAFLPPVDKPVDLPEYIKKFVDKKRPLILLPATTLRYHNKKELYGVEFTILAMPTILKRYNNAGLLVLFANKQNKTALNKLTKLLKGLNIENSVLIAENIVGNLEQFYKVSQLVVRPTITDGDSLSVREALYFGTPVVASDAVVRPEGCLLFETLNSRSFLTAIDKALSVNPAYMQAISNKIRLESEEMIRKLLGLYGVKQ